MALITTPPRTPPSSSSPSTPTSSSRSRSEWTMSSTPRLPTLPGHIFVGNKALRFHGIRAKQLISRMEGLYFSDKVMFHEHLQVLRRLNIDLESLQLLAAYAIPWNQSSFPMAWTTIRGFELWLKINMKGWLTKVDPVEAKYLRHSTPIKAWRRRGII